MTRLPEMTREEIAAHALKIATADDKEQFVAAFAAYVRDVVEREEDPYEKVALFAHSMVDGHRAMIVELSRLRGGAVS